LDATWIYQSYNLPHHPAVHYSVHRIRGMDAVLVPSNDVTKGGSVYWDIAQPKTTAGRLKQGAEHA
jgi:hypothetical protein